VQDWETSGIDVELLEGEEQDPEEQYCPQLKIGAFGFHKFSQIFDF
jgi:hypothetical protein